MWLQYEESLSAVANCAICEFITTLWRKLDALAYATIPICEVCIAVIFSHLISTCIHIKELGTALSPRQSLIGSSRDFTCEHGRSRA